MEINLCGTRKSDQEAFSKEAAKIIGSGLISIISRIGDNRVLDLKTGGTIGFPEQVVKSAQGCAKNELVADVIAYTPVANEEEWSKYSKLGIGNINIYNKVKFTPGETTEANIKSKALARINRLLAHGDATIAYARAGEPSTTKLESQISAHVEIPTYVLTPGQREELQQEFNVVEKSPIRVYDDPMELLFELNKCMEEKYGC